MSSQRNRTTTLLHGRHACTLGLAAFAALACAPASALTVACINNSVQLRDALTQSTSINDDVAIRLRSGFYTTSGNTFELYAEPGFTRSFTGGWNAGCTLQTQSPTATVIDGGNLNSVLRVNHVGTFTNGSSTFIANLSISGGGDGNGAQGGLVVSAENGTPTVLIERIVVRACTDNGVSIRNGTGANITLRNSLIADNLGNAAVAVISSVAAANTYLTNNTIVGNRSTTPTLAGGVSRINSTPLAGNIHLRNNAIIGNFASDGSPLDVRFSVGNPSNHQLNNNAVQAFGDDNFTANNTVMTSTPGFLGSNNFALRATSPLRNAGSTLNVIVVGPQDFDFNSRVLEAAIDIGAYEYEGLFRSSFE